MNLVIKHFNQLSAEELYSIYMLRVAVFVVEQKCAYQEVDELDKDAYHLWLEDESGIVAYSRVLPPGKVFEDAAIGRVIAVKRRIGLGTKIVQSAIDVARTKFGSTSITLEAQVYARTLYEKLGFVQTSEEFLEDNIPHIQMKLGL